MECSQTLKRALSLGWSVPWNLLYTVILTTMPPKTAGKGKKIAAAAEDGRQTRVVPGKWASVVLQDQH